MEKRNLHCVSSEEKSAVLVNTIVKCMREHNMTLENLNNAKDIVEDVYRKNARLEG